MSDLPPPLPTAKELLSRAGLWAKKSWGQNFLADPNVTKEMVAALGVTPGRVVVEIGAGLGALTHPLLVAGAQVLAVERDRELVPLLRDALAWAGSRLTVLERDAATLAYDELAAQHGGPLLVAGNLPYQISSRLLVSLADAGAHIEGAAVMVQKEVADRLVAGPGSRTYGLLSVLVQRAFKGRVLRVVKPGAFLPPPKINSATVLLTRGERLPAASDAAVVGAARAAFSQRRKTLRNAVSGYLGQPAAAVEEAICEAGLDPKARAEDLDLEAFAALGSALQGRGWLTRR